MAQATHQVEVVPLLIPMEIGCPMKRSRLHPTFVASLILALILAGSIVNTGVVRASSSVRPGDEIVAGTGDADGYHVFVARAPGWQWTGVATILPDGSRERPWVGSECLSGDGAWAVVVVADETTADSPLGRNHGADAYVVNLGTGTGRQVAAGVALTYFTPSCGTDDAFALVRYADGDQSSTEILTGHAKGGILVSTKLHGEVTSPIPGPGTGYAVRWRQLVSLIPGHTDKTIATLPGQIFQLVPNGSSGISLLTLDSAGQVGLWSWTAARGLLRLGGAARNKFKLFMGRAGATSVVGNIVLDSSVRSPDSPIVVAHAKPLPLGMSLDGSVERSNLPVTRKGKPAEFSILRSTSGASVARSRFPRPGHTVVQQSTALKPPASIQTSTSSNTTSPVCAVPRNDPSYQVLQPTSDRVNWAIQEGVRGLLGGSNARPAGIYNMGLPAYSPSSDFPTGGLIGGSSAMPPQLVNGLLAQESNWDQASFHALPGMAGNPLIADYYGTDSSFTTIDYDNADCGYGIGQVTDFMRFDSTAKPQSIKVKVAIDYAENVAASLQILASKWNDLAANGITLNNADPAFIENWYFAAWAYNSGVHENPGTGDPWGLGWTNNPVNPIYPPDRLPFLSQGYSDAEHPQDWPYQELVMGWVESPLIGPNGSADYQGVTGLYLPTDYKMFCTAQNMCDPTSTSQPCQRGDLKCWWHWPAQFTSCPSQCNPGSFTYSSSAAEPSPNFASSECQLEGREFHAGGTVVFNETTDLNLIGCPTAPVTWTPTGTFSAQFGTNADGAPSGVIDYHQIGEGFGGHFFFTHSISPTDTAHYVNVTWTPPSSVITGLPYEIQAWIPATGATTTAANYVINPGGGGGAVTRPIDQNAIAGQWVSLGYYAFGSGASISLSNVTTSGPIGSDVAFTALVFVQVHTYAALGDSYSSGEGAPPFFMGTETPEDTCHRTYNSYPEQFSQQTNAFSTRPIMDVTCSGAVTANIDTTAQGVEGIQLNAVPIRPTVITITIGGNDLGFDQIAQDCATDYYLYSTSHITCQQQYTDPNTGQDIVSQRIQAVTSKLIRVYSALHSKVAANGTVLVLTYPQVLDPSQGPSCLTEPFLPSDRDWLRAKTHEFDQAIISAANSAGVSYLNEEGAFSGHEICTASPFTNGVYYPPSPYVEYSLHPNSAGLAKEAADVEARLAL